MFDAENRSQHFAMVLVWMKFVLMETVAAEL